MQGKIEVLRDLKVEVDLRHGALSYDLVLIATFSSKEDFDAYLVHPVPKYQNTLRACWKREHLYAINPEKKIGIG
jgi:hypothetical protein